LGSRWVPVGFPVGSQWVVMGGGWSAPTATATAADADEETANAYVATELVQKEKIEVVVQKITGDAPAYDWKTDAGDDHGALVFGALPLFPGRDKD